MTRPDGWHQQDEWRLWQDGEVVGFVYHTTLIPAPRNWVWVWTPFGEEGCCDYVTSCAEARQAVEAKLGEKS